MENNIIEVYNVNVVKNKIYNQEKEGNHMMYLYSISTVLSYIFLILFFIRVLINKNNINFKNNNFGWQVLLSLIILSIIPMVNMFMAIFNIYISTFMKRANFIQIMNE